MLKLGDKEIKSLKFGSKNIEAVYLGVNKIWPTDSKYLQRLENGAIRALDAAESGREYELDGVTYYVAADKEDVKNKIFNEGYPANRIVVTRVTKMDALFQDRMEFNQPLDTWDMANVVSCDGMFLLAASFNQPIGNWDMSSCINYYNMFSSAVSFNQPLDGWKVSENAVFVGNMFSAADSFNSPIPHFTKISDGAGMFWHAGIFNHELNWLTPDILVNLSTNISMYQSMFENTPFAQNKKHYGMTAFTGKYLEELLVMGLCGFGGPEKLEGSPVRVKAEYLSDPTIANTYQKVSDTEIHYVPGTKEELIDKLAYLNDPTSVAGMPNCNYIRDTLQFCTTLITNMDNLAPLTKAKFEEKGLPYALFMSIKPSSRLEFMDLSNVTSAKRMFADLTENNIELGQRFLDLDLQMDPSQVDVAFQNATDPEFARGFIADNGFSTTLNEYGFRQEGINIGDVQILTVIRNKLNQIHENLGMPLLTNKEFAEYLGVQVIEIVFDPGDSGRD